MAPRKIEAVKYINFIKFLVHHQSEILTHGLKGRLLKDAAGHIFGRNRFTQSQIRLTHLFRNYKPVILHDMELIGNLMSIVINIPSTSGPINETARPVYEPHLSPNDLKKLAEILVVSFPSYLNLNELPSNMVVHSLARQMFQIHNPSSFNCGIILLGIYCQHKQLKFEMSRLIEGNSPQDITEFISDNSISGIIDDTNSYMKLKDLIEEMDDLPIEDDPVTSEEIKVDIIINNITSGFTVGCEIDFKKLPQKYVTKSKTNQAATFKIDGCTIVLRSSGKLQCMGASSEDQAMSAAKKSVEILRSWGFEATFNDYKMNALFCSCLMPWRIHIEPMVTKHPDLFTYEPEIQNFCTLKVGKEEGSLSIYASGSVRIVGHTIEMVSDILEKALPFLSKFRK